MLEAEVGFLLFSDAGFGAAFFTVVLLVMLVIRELSANLGPRGRWLARLLNVALVPMLIVFVVTVLARFWISSS